MFSQWWVALVKTLSNDSNDKYFHFFWGSDFQKLRSKCLDTCSDIHCSYMSMQIRVFFSYFLWEGTNYQPHHTAGQFFQFVVAGGWIFPWLGLYFQLGWDLRPVLLCWRAMVWGSKRADGIVKGMPRNPWEGVQIGWSKFHVMYTYTIYSIIYIYVYLNSWVYISPNSRTCGGLVREITPRLKSGLQSK